MPSEANGKNSLLGEFLVALARAPESVQEAVILHGLKQMTPYSSTLINPYPMMSHMKALVDKGVGDGASDTNGAE